VLEYATTANVLVTIYTVPAGKTLFLTNLHAHVYFGVATTASVMIYDGTPALWRNLAVIVSFANTAFPTPLAYWPPVEIPAGYSVRILTGAAGCIMYVTLHGWVE